MNRFVAHRSFRSWGLAALGLGAVGCSRASEDPIVANLTAAGEIRTALGRLPKRARRRGSRPRDRHRLGDAQGQVHVRRRSPPTMPPYAVNKDQATCAPGGQAPAAVPAGRFGRQGDRQRRDLRPQGVARSRGLGPRTEHGAARSEGLRLPHARAGGDRLVSRSTSEQRQRRPQHEHLGQNGFNADGSPAAASALRREEGRVSSAAGALQHSPVDALLHAAARERLLRDHGGA